MMLYGMTLVSTGSGSGLLPMMTPSNGNIFRVTGPLWGESSHWWSPHKGQLHGALMFSLICTWTNGWVNHGDVSDWRRHHAHYDVRWHYVMIFCLMTSSYFLKHFRLTINGTLKNTFKWNFNKIKKKIPAYSSQNAICWMVAILSRIILHMPRLITILQNLDGVSIPEI